MPYSHTTYAQLRAQLATRLDDISNQFWTDIEIGIYLQESMRTFGLLSGFWRQRASLVSITGTAFYDITIQTFGNPTLASLLGYTITDRDLIQTIQYHLLESASSQSSWTGTEMFTLDDLRYAIQRRRDQFLSDTGIVVTRSLINIPSPPIGRQSLIDSIIDVRRAAWLGASPFNYYNPLWREDERLLTAADQGWSINTATPEAYSIMGPQPLTLQLAPVPISNGQLELLTVNSGAALNPASSSTILGIPDDLTPAVKWGALADLLGKDGIARDVIRANYCEQRYQQYVVLARLLPIIIHSELNGVPLIPCTLQELESSTPSWENIQKTPTDIAIAAPNLIALSPVPDQIYSVTLDIVQTTPIPVADNDPIQIRR